MGHADKMKDGYTFRITPGYEMDPLKATFSFVHNWNAPTPFTALSSPTPNVVTIAARPRLTRALPSIAYAFGPIRTC